MTGVMTESRVGTEGRDPSPSLAARPTESSDEPWDERPSTTSKPAQQQQVKSPLETMMMGAEKIVRGKLTCDFFEGEEFEDGDLPPLSLPKERVSGQLVSGEKSKRPLSPPSTKGLQKDVASNRKSKKRPITPRTAKKVAAQRQFWSQLDPPSPYTVTEDEDENPTDEPEDEQHDDEGPDDEVAARRAVRSRELDDMPQQQDEYVEGDDGDGNGQNQTCMEMTLTSITNMCGTEQKPPLVEDGNRAAPNTAQVVYDDAEEYTAIEVEYVDPGLGGPPVTKAPPVEKEKTLPSESVMSKELPHKKAEDGVSVEVEESEASAWSASRKNALLAAMARKAKEDFEKHEEDSTKHYLEDNTRQAPSESPVKVKSSAAVPEQDTNGVYKSFSPSEKRKFLKLINSGMTPTESSNKIVEERKEKKIAKSPDSGGKKRFSFWKKSPQREKGDASLSPTLPKQDESSEDLAPPADRSIDVPLTPDKVELVESSTTPIPEESVEVTEDAIAPIPKESESVAASQATALKSSVNATYSPAVEAMNEEYDETLQRPIPAEVSPDVDETSEKGNAAQKDAESIVPSSVDKDKPVNGGAVAAGVVGIAGAVALAEASPRARTDSWSDESDDSTDEDGVRRQFAKSGVNYYDGIRRELPEEEDSEDEEVLSSPSGANKHGSKASIFSIMNPRSQGFSSLHSERDLKIALNESLNAETSKSPASAVSPRGRQKSKNGKNRSSALSPDSASSGTRRYLGLPVLLGSGNRFTPLVDEDDGMSEREVIASIKPNENRELDSTPLSQSVQKSIADEDLGMNEAAGTASSESRELYSAPATQPIERAEPTAGNASTDQHQRDTSVEEGDHLAVTGAAVGVVAATQSVERTEPKTRDVTLEKGQGRTLAKEERLPAGGAAVVAAAAVGAIAVASRDESNELAEEVIGDQPVASLEDPFDGLEADGSDVKESKNQETDVDTSLGSYLDSAAIHSYSHNNDQMSVVSGRSARTAGTAMTGASSVHTQSSRKRRPGAAKDRLAKAKAAERRSSSKKGWHESIRAAASNTNRVWDPQKGWVDYKDPYEDAQQTPHAEERLHLSLDKSIIRSPGVGDEASQLQMKSKSHTTPAVVPFPSDWEKERIEMLSPPGTEEPPSPTVGRQVTPQSTLDKAMTPPRDAGGGSRSRSVTSKDSPTKPQGWVESMQAASSIVSKDGRRWDPDNGWVGIEDNVILDSNVEPIPIEGESESLSTKDFVGEKSVPSRSSGQRGGSPTSIYEALTQVRTDTALNETHGVAEEELRAVEPIESEAKSPKQAQTSATPAAITQVEESTEGGEQVMATGARIGAEKYIQLGDNGSVRSVRHSKKHAGDREAKLPFHTTPRKSNLTSKPTAADKSLNDDDRAPLLAENDVSDTNEDKAPTEVNVIKEKIDEDDISLFARDDSVSANQSHSSKRRGTGPVDLDELDDEGSFSDIEEEEDEDEEPAWEPDSFMQGNVSPGMFVKPRSERTASAMNNTSFAAAAAAKKTPPKLQKSKRDTSPIRPKEIEDTTVKSRSLRDVASPELGPEASGTSPGTSPAPGEGSPHEDIHLHTSLSEAESVGSSVKMIAKQWESRSKGEEHAARDHDDSFDYDEKQIHHGLGDFSPTRVDDGDNAEVSWQSAGDRTPSAGTKEWKSFLGKKVRAESEAAASQEKTKKLDDNGKHVDTVPFEVHSSPNSHKAAALEHRRARHADQIKSSPDGFSDVSPIPTREEGDFDDSRMEQVSDTGTAVEQGSFMKRLSACAAPISRAMNRTENCSPGEGLPSAHLAFMRSNPAASPTKESGSAKFVPPAWCGRPDTITEDDVGDDYEDDNGKAASPRGDWSSPSAQKKSSTRSPTKSRTRPSPQSAGSDVRSPSSSVASEDFGARTSYLEAIAMRTAVAKPSRRRSGDKRSNEDRRSTVSDDMSESKLSHAERWQAFLERKASSTASPPGSRAQSTSEVSRAAEKYAAGKVEEMIEAMAYRSKSTPRNWQRDSETGVDDSMDTFSGGSSSSPLSPYGMSRSRSQGSSSRGSPTKSKMKSESAKAAEELAAARVEAMMAAMTSSTLDEGEI